VNRLIATNVLRRHWPYLAALQLPLVALGVLLLAPDLDIRFLAGTFHLVLMSVIAVCALVVACLAASASARTRQPGLVLLAAGCIGVGVLLLGHGLTTPFVLGQPLNRWVNRLPYLALGWFTLCLSLASTSRTRRLIAPLGRRPVRTFVAVVAVLGSLTALVSLDPTALGGSGDVQHEPFVKNVITYGCTALLLPVSWIHWRRFRLGLDIVQASLSIAAVMTAGALLSMHLGEQWRLSWWDYHGCLLAAFAGVAWAVLHRWRATRRAADVLDEAFSHDPLTLIAANYPIPLRALVEEMEAKDAYTHGHSARTAALAVSLGVRLGLAPDDLRTLAQGAYLHDIGKLTIPDEILNKPDLLTDDERAAINTHPDAGCEIASEHTVLAPCLPIIRHHHERMDGAGYPAGLAGEDIPLLARIAAVADVWDALTTDRAYRPGWQPERALDHIVDGAGSHLDPVVVAALLDLAGDLGLRPSGLDGDASQITSATTDCHEACVGSADLVPELRRRLATLEVRRPNGAS